MARQVYERRADIGKIGISRRCGSALLDKNLHGMGICGIERLDIIQGIVDIIEGIVP